MTNTNLLKSAMVANGDTAFVDVLAQTLHISRPTASGKLNNKIPFTQEEIIELFVKYKMDQNQLINIFMDDERVMR